MNIFKFLIASLLVVLGCLCPAADLGVKKDSDGDGVPDAVENEIGTSPVSKDSDHDGSSDYDELKFHVSPLDAEEKVVSTFNEKTFNGMTQIVAVVSKRGVRSNQPAPSITMMVHFFEVDSYVSGLKLRKKKRDSDAAVAAVIRGKEAEVALRKKKLAELDLLESRADELYEIYKKNPTLRTSGEWSEAFSKALALKWELFPASRPVAPTKTKIEQLQEEVERLREEVEEGR